MMLTGSTEDANLALATNFARGIPTNLNIIFKKGEAMPTRYEPYHYLREALEWPGPEGTEENGYLLLRELGRIYGKTSHKVGAKLKELNLRDDDGRPTDRAFALHLVAPRGYPKYTWAWDEGRTCSILEDEAGW
jgi:hypothetical protein